MAAPMAMKCISVCNQLFSTTPRNPQHSAAKNQRLRLTKAVKSHEAAQATAKVAQNISQGKSVGASPVKVRMVRGTEMAVATEIQPASSPLAASEI